MGNSRHDESCQLPHSVYVWLATNPFWFGVPFSKEKAADNFYPAKQGSSFHTLTLKNWEAKVPPSTPLSTALHSDWSGQCWEAGPEEGRALKELSSTHLAMCITPSLKGWASKTLSYYGSPEENCCLQQHFWIHDCHFIFTCFDKSLQHTQDYASSEGGGDNEFDLAVPTSYFSFSPTKF